ncbi:MFS transporter [Novosphingobium sp. FSY-8]|uniref:MFS transporter n=1 Tax=Novosphingobium ovatum TaxID=1908523 RepID=A0ABW9XBV7_9SPHN|nr:MFS transporter [Novosphingobium ovatum]NBC36027.1 MFS transporter [Novosphingobium ovatum]
MTAPAPSRYGYAWYVVALLTLAYALAILDRVSISLLIVPLQKSLHINDTQFGLLQGMAFSIVYSVLGLPMGMLVDRWRRVPILLIGLTVWSIATAACSLADTFWHLFAARMMVGVGEAALVPVATSLIADLFLPGMRPKAYGVFTTGSTFGTAAALGLSGLFLGWADGLIAGMPGLFGHMQPWQIVFILCGAPGVVLALVCLLTVREPPRRDAPVVAEADAPGPFSLRPIVGLIASRPMAYGGFLLGSVLNLVCVYAIVGWFPALFIRVHDWTAAATGKMLGLVSLPVSIFAAVNSGWVIVWLARRGHSDAPVLVAGTCAASMVVLGTAACLAPTATIALVFYVLNALFVNWNTSAVYAGLAQITPNHLRAQMMSVHTILSGLVALTAGNAIVGFLSDYVFAWKAGIAWSLGVVFFGCGLASMAVFAAVRPHFRAASAAQVQED